jgi:hypothetical protein
MLTYVFGDLRQLRKFELARPPISHPRAISIPHYRPDVSPSPAHSVSSQMVQPPNLPPFHSVRKCKPPQPPFLNIPPSSQPAIIRESPVSRFSSPTDSPVSSNPVSLCDTSPSAAERHDFTIEISSVVYEDFTVEGPSTGSPIFAHVSATEFTTTAPFIHPYDEGDVNGTRELYSEGRQAMEPFDFDLLPTRGHLFPRDRGASIAANDMVVAPSIKLEKDGRDTITQLRSPKDILRLIQRRCNKLISPMFTNPSSAYLRSSMNPTAQLKAMKAVPAFTVPFTHVLSPVVTRAQWEIIMRSVVIAGMVCWTIVGCLLAIPVVR